MPIYLLKGRRETIVREECTLTITAADRDEALRKAYPDLHGQEQDWEETKREHRGTWIHETEVLADGDEELS